MGAAAESSDYQQKLRQALTLLPPGLGQPVAASLYTTQPATGDLARMARQTKAGLAAPIDCGHPARIAAGKGAVRCARRVWREG